MYPSTHPAHSSVVRHGARMLAAGLCLAAAVAIWALVVGRFDDTSARVLLTGVLASFCTLGGLAGSTALSLESRIRRVGEVTIGLSQVTFVLALALLWIPDATDGETLTRALGVASVLALAGAHASLLISRLSGLDTRAVHRLSQAAIACASSAALLVSGVFVVSEGPVASGIWRLVGVLVVLAVLNTLLVPLVRKLARDTPRHGADHRGVTS